MADAPRSERAASVQPVLGSTAMYTTSPLAATGPDLGTAVAASSALDERSPSITLALDVDKVARHANQAPGQEAVWAPRTCSARVPTARRCRLPHARRPGAQPDPRTPPSARSPGSRRRTSEGLSAHLARHPGGRRAARRRRRPSLVARRRTMVLRAARLVILIFCPLMILPRALMTVPPPPSPCRSRPHLLRLLLLVLLHRAARCS